LETCDTADLEVRLGSLRYVSASFLSAEELLAELLAEDFVNDAPFRCVNALSHWLARPSSVTEDDAVFGDTQTPVASQIAL
jgi:hypothetical protein